MVIFIFEYIQLETKKLYSVFFYLYHSLLYMIESKLNLTNSVLGIDQSLQKRSSMSKVLETISSGLYNVYVYRAVQPDSDNIHHVLRSTEDDFLTSILCEKG